LEIKQTIANNPMIRFVMVLGPFKPAATCDISSFVGIKGQKWYQTNGRLIRTWSFCSVSIGNNCHGFWNWGCCCQH